MQVIPKPEDWAPRWVPEPPPGWVDAVNTIVAATLAVPIELNDAQTEAAYNEWFERRHLEPLRAVWPERYQAVVEQVRAFILDGEDKDEEKQEESSKAGQQPEPTQATSEKASRARESNRKAKSKGKAESKGRR